MQPINFPESNTIFGPPSELAETQCMSISAYCGPVVGGSCDGAQICVTAWKPTDQELEDLKLGKPIYLTFIGGIPPHYASLNFHDATHPA